MCSEPAMRVPLSGCFGPYSSRVAIRPGISVSAMEISLAPNSARLMSLTMYSVAGEALALAVMTVPELPMESGAGRRLDVPIAGASGRSNKDIKISLYGFRSGARTRARSRRYAAGGNPMAKHVVASDTAVALVDDEAPVVRSLSALRAAENECRRCPLYRN